MYEKRGLYSDLGEEQCTKCGRKLVVLEEVTREMVRMGRGSSYAGEDAELVACSCAHCGTVNTLIYRIG